MKIIKPELKQDLLTNPKVNRLYMQLQDLLEKSDQKKLSDNAVQFINQEIEEINSANRSQSEIQKLIKQKQTLIIKFLEKELKIVPKNYYRNLWLAIGMTAFGLPIGTAFGIISGNMGLLAVGLPIGLGIGAAVGTSLDKKALEEGRQIDVEIKY